MNGVLEIIVSVGGQLLQVAQRDEETFLEDLARTYTCEQIEAGWAKEDGAVLSLVEEIIDMSDRDITTHFGPVMITFRSNPRFKDLLRAGNYRGNVLAGVASAVYGLNLR